jgi:predicted adenylyl cyclase CyaB
VREIEIKIRVDDLEAVRRRLLALGAKILKERYDEENTLYDWPDRRLTKSRQALRVRRINRKTFLTFKGVPEKSRRFKIRMEHETEIRNGKDFVRILQNLGFVPVFRYAKHRTVLGQGTLKICLDETVLGYFLEFEGDREKIVRLARALGYPPSAWIRQDYVELLIAAGRGG